MPIRLALILAGALLAAAGPAAAQSTSPRHNPMHPNTLTLRGHGRQPASHHRYHNHVHSTFNQPTHIHGTMAGPRM